MVSPMAIMTQFICPTRGRPLRGFSRGANQARHGLAMTGQYYIFTCFYRLHQLRKLSPRLKDTYFTHDLPLENYVQNTPDSVHNKVNNNDQHENNRERNQ